MPKLDGSGVIVKLGLAGWFASSKEDSPDSPFDSASDPPIVIGIGWCRAVVGVADAVVAAAADAVGVEGEKEEAAGEKEAAEDENLSSPTLDFPSAAARAYSRIGEDWARACAEGLGRTV